MHSSIESTRKQKKLFYNITDNFFDTSNVKHETMFPFLLLTCTKVVRNILKYLLLLFFFINCKSDYQPLKPGSVTIAEITFNGFMAMKLKFHLFILSRKIFAE